MVTVVLRVAGEHLDLERCRAWIPPARLEKVWRPGDKRMGRRTSADFGFNLMMSEGSSTASVVEESFEFFQRIASHVAALVQQGARAELDIGLMVGPDAASLSVRILVEFMRALQHSGVTLVVSAYPCSD